jgi:putative transposase
MRARAVVPAEAKDEQMPPAHVPEGTNSMKRSKSRQKQIAYALSEVGRGRQEAAICKELGIRNAKFNTWKRKYGRLDTSDLRRMLRLEEDNKRLKAEVANLMLKNLMLSRSTQNASRTRRTVAPRSRRCETRL